MCNAANIGGNDDLVILRRQVAQLTVAQLVGQRRVLAAYSGSSCRMWPYSLTVTPQPEAFTTMASTVSALPSLEVASTSGHQASILARICALPLSWSFRWNLTAPQQPAFGTTTV